MTDTTAGRDLATLLDLVEPFVTPRTAGDPSLVAALAAAARARRDTDLAALLRDAGDAGDPAAGHADLVLLDEPSAAAFGSAAARILPGGAALAVTRSADGADLAAAARDAGDGRRVAVNELSDCRVVVARRSNPVPRIALLPDGPGACLQIRTLGPFEALESRGDLELCVLSRDATPLDLARADLLVLQRYGGAPAVSMMLAARRMATPVAVELDDDLFNLPWYNPGARGYSAFETRLLLTAVLRGAEAIVTSTPYLKERMGNFNDRVEALHNLVDTTLFTRRPPPSDRSGVTRFGYIGTRTHREDFRPVVGPLRRLLLERPGAVEAVFIGHVPDELRRVPGVRYLGWFDAYHNAAAALGRSGATVALAPLMDLEFNRSKSAMKYLEYGACGIPGIFSDVAAYRGFVRHAETGWLVERHNEADWDAALRRAADRPDERDRIADAAWADVRANHSIERRADDVLRIYRSVLDDGPRAAPRVPSPAPSPAPSTVPGLTAVVVLPRRLTPAIDALATTREALPDATRIVAICDDEDVRRALELGGGIESSAATTTGRLNGVAEAVNRIADGAILVLDGRSAPHPGWLRTLAAALESAAAAGPRVVAPGSEQSVLALFDDAPPAHATLDDMLRDAALRTPITPVPWLDPHCVLLDAAAVAAVGGLDDALTWEDALTDLCLRLRADRRGVVVANGACVDSPPAAGDDADDLPARRRRDSRLRLSARVSSCADLPASATLRDPARLFGADGAVLEICVVARAGSSYLPACLDRIARWNDVPATLRVVHAEDDTDSIEAIRRAGGDAVAAAGGDDQAAAVRGVLARTAARHVLLVHDGVALTPGAVRAMVNVMLQRAPTAVAPFSNDGPATQRLSFDAAPTLATLDRLVRDNVSRRTARAARLAVCGVGCVLVDVAALRELSGTDMPDPRRLVRSGNGAAIMLAPRAYAHVLGHPADLDGLGFGPWPGGPFDHGIVPDTDAALHDLASFVSRARPLLDALRRNPGDARVLAALGVLYLARGDLEHGMSFVERARGIDPFDPAVTAALAHGRTTLDAAVG